MPSQLRRHVSYANVIATIALFIALGGSSYAAFQLKKGSVRGKHIAKNAVTSSKVKNRSLRGKDFKAGELPAGKKGDKGDQGPQGSQGPQGPQGPAAQAQRIDFRSAKGPTQQVLSLGGLVLQATCVDDLWNNANLDVAASTTVDNSMVHATFLFGSSDGGSPTPEAVYDEDFDTTDSLQLFDIGIEDNYDIQGTLVYSTPTGTHVTVIFQSHDDRGGTTPLGGSYECVFTGTALQTSP